MLNFFCYYFTQIRNWIPNLCKIYEDLFLNKNANPDFRIGIFYTI
ncbi:hypothetical protein SAMN05443549_108136 [Flavobacterium fluvii]|uniref:Uncharacterized protein n=1 Tax=Flavobacterium fluvii TaxID=468056 RepID=A0A1M5NSR2_9FLAO|nr:hypothetical protein SAMN05443549_108136 [Flavobacterium fluvii]